MNASNGEAFDIFLSYKTRKYLEVASFLHERLVKAGYSVWFDRLVLAQKETTRREYTKRELIRFLVNAVSHAKCSVVLEAELELVMLPPGMTRDYALSNQLAMEHSGGVLINWNWQKLEIDFSTNIVAIYYKARKVHATYGKNTPSLIADFSDHNSLFEAVRSCLRALGI